MNLYSAVFDLIIVAIIVLSVYYGYRKGFLCTIVDTIGRLLATITAFIASRLLTPVVFDTIIKPGISSSIENIFNSNDAVNGLTNFMVNLDNIGLIDNIPDFDTLVASGLENTTETIVNLAIRPFVEPMIYLIVFFVVLMLALFILKLIKKIFIGIKSFPLIGPFDDFLGAVVGVVRGVLLAVILVFSVILLSSFMNNSVINSKNINDSISVNIAKDYIPLPDNMLLK